MTIAFIQKEVSVAAIDELIQQIQDPILREKVLAARNGQDLDVIFEAEGE